MKKLFKKTLGWLLVVSMIICSFVGTLTVSAETESDVHMQVDFLVRDKLGYSFYAYGDGLSEYDSLEIAVDYSYYDYDEATGENYVLASKTEVYEYEVGTVIEYDEIAAYEMMLGTTFTLNCYTGGELALSKSGTITYASLVYATMQAAEDKTVYIDMLNYGAAAQDYFASNNPNTDLANNTDLYGLPTDLEGIDAYQQYATSDDLACATLATNDANISIELGARIGAALQILSSNRLVFVVDPGDYAGSDLELNIYYGDNVTTVSVDSLELVGNYYYYYPSEEEAIALYDVDEIVYADLYCGEEIVAMKMYSVEAFVAESMMDGGKLEALGDALMKFAYSAKKVIFGAPKDYEGLRAVTEIEDGKSYYIVNKATGTVLTTTQLSGYCWYSDGIKYIAMGGEPAAEDTDNLWTFTQTGFESYRVTAPDGRYLKPNTMSGEVTYNQIENVINVYYDIYAEAWVIYRDFYDYPDMYGPLQVVNTSTGNDGAIGAYSTVLGEDYTYWYLYEIVDENDDGNDEDYEDVVTVTYLEYVTEIEDGASYLIVNKATGTVLTTQQLKGYCWYSDNIDYIAMGDEPSIYDTDNLWTFTNIGYQMYEITSPIGRWLKPNTMNANITIYPTDVDLNVYYDDENEGWVIYRDFYDYPNMYAPLQVVNTDTGEDGAIGAYETVLGVDYGLWEFYEIVTVAITDGEFPEEEYEVTEDGFQYFILDDEAWIYLYLGTDENVVIPEEIEGYPVTSIDYLAFAYNPDVVTVTIPDTVTYIDYGAFAYCEDLKEINIPSSVTTIGEAAFAFCEDLTSLTVPASVTEIGDAAFAYCTHLTEVTYNAATVPVSAFEGCTKLEKIYFSKNLTSVGEGAFYDTEALTDLYYEGGPEELEYVFVDDYNDCLGNVTVHYNCTGLPTE